MAVQMADGSWAPQQKAQHDAMRRWGDATTAAADASFPAALTLPSLSAGSNEEALHRSKEKGKRAEEESQEAQEKPCDIGEDENLMRGRH